MALTRGQVLDAVLNANVGGSTEKCVLFVLDNYIRDHASGWPTIGTIADAANCCEQTVRSAIKKLAELGMVVCRPRQRRDGSSSSNEYAINYENLVPTPQVLIPPPATRNTPTLQVFVPPLKRPSEAPTEPEDGPLGFVCFWDAYPKCARKVNRAGCLKIWQRNRLEEKRTEIQIGLDQWIPVWKSEQNKWVPLVATFLNQSRWESDPGPVAGAASSTHDPDGRPKVAMGAHT